MACFCHRPAPQGAGRVACFHAMAVLLKGGTGRTTQDYIAEGEGAGGIVTRPKPDHAADAERLRL